MNAVAALPSVKGTLVLGVVCHLHLPIGEKPINLRKLAFNLKPCPNYRSDSFSREQGYITSGFEVITPFKENKLGKINNRTEAF